LSAGGVTQAEFGPQVSGCTLTSRHQSTREHPILSPRLGRGAPAVGHFLYFMRTNTPRSELAVMEYRIAEYRITRSLIEAGGP
jgi:hypothetical protein